MKLLGTLATASITGIGLAIGGTIGPVVLAGIGINLSSSILENGCLNLKERWLNGSDGLLNHDIQKALARSFEKALCSLETKYFALEDAKVLRDYERQSIRELFKEFRESAKETLLAAVKEVELSSGVVNRLFNVPGLDSEALWKWFVGDGLVAPYGSHFRDFVRQNLVEETMLWFAEELKTDSRDTNKAWRAFQRMLLEGIYADVRAVRANQDLISQDLQKLDALKAQLDQLTDKVERRLPDELFQQELKTAIVVINSTLREIARRSQRIDRNVEDIRNDVKQLLNVRPEPESPEELEKKISQIRQSMITADSHWELREASYKLDQILAKHPHYFEARLLKDQMGRALAYGAPRSSDCTLAGAAPSQASPAKLSNKGYDSVGSLRLLFWLAIPVVVLLLFLLFLLLVWLGA